MGVLPASKAQAKAPPPPELDPHRRLPPRCRAAAQACVRAWAGTACSGTAIRRTTRWLCPGTRTASLTSLATSERGGREAHTLGAGAHWVPCCLRHSDASRRAARRWCTSGGARPMRAAGGCRLWRERRQTCAHTTPTTAAQPPQLWIPAHARLLQHRRRPRHDRQLRGVSQELPAGEPCGGREPAWHSVNGHAAGSAATQPPRRGPAGARAGDRGRVPRLLQPHPLLPWRSRHHHELRACPLPQAPGAWLGEGRVREQGPGQAFGSPVG